MYPIAGPATEPPICGHCQRPAVDRSSYNGVAVCNPDSGSGVMECYRLIRDFSHEFNCVPCQVMGGTGITEYLEHTHE